MFKVKMPIFIPHAPPTPKLSFVLLYGDPFSSYGPILGTLHQMTPKMTIDMFNVKSMDTTYNPNAQTFINSLYDQPFSSYGPVLTKVH